jgi:hypothetical protein
MYLCCLGAPKASYDASGARCPTLRCRDAPQLARLWASSVGWLEEVLSCGRNGTHRRDEMKIDIDKLSEAELVDLNNRIIARLRFLREMRAHEQMLEFSVGDHVSFQPEGRPVLTGMVTRYNRKTVTVITESGEHWTVSPGLLRKVQASEKKQSTPANVVRLPKK